MRFQGGQKFLLSQGTGDSLVGTQDLDVFLANHAGDEAAPVGTSIFRVRTLASALFRPRTWAAALLQRYRVGDSISPAHRVELNIPRGS